MATAAGAAAFDLQGHRGARAVAPENTLAGFEVALAIGVTTLEADLALTADGVLVLSHDPRLKAALTRDPDGRWLESDGAPIVTLKAADVARYDVGRLNPAARYAAAWPRQSAVDGQRIPTLEQLFALARSARTPSGAPVRFNLETKLAPDSAVPTGSAEDFARALASAVAEAGMLERVTIQSFDWRSLRALRQLVPAVRTSCLTIEADTMNTVRAEAGAASPWHAGLRRSDYGGSLPRLVQAAGCAVWSPFWRNLTAADVAEARTLGLAVIPWTVNEAADIGRMLDLGVNGLITDDPELARTVLARRGIAVE